MPTTPLTPQMTRLLADLGNKVDERIRLDLQEVQLVAQCRMHGCSWAQIALMLGTTTQAAWERYRPNIPKPPTAAQPILPWDSDKSE